MQITVDYSQDAGPLSHFWRSTGFTPASLLLNADMRQTMTYAGSIPHGGITYVRIHYLLELIIAENLGTDRPRYDWSALDKALDVLISNNLKPFFELMGNVSGYFTDFLDETQLWAWRRLVRDLAQSYIDRYGLDEVRSWYFETWNEPDIRWWTQSEEAFCNYYDACSEGLKDADEKLRMGGPGTCRTLSSMLKTFLAHCDSGKNYFTGETGVRLDFISVHEKGARSSPEDLNPNTMSIVDREIRIIEYIRANHPRLAEIPFMNNECDPQVGWLDFHTWRGKPYYAAIICKMINQHLVRIVDGLGCNYTLLSGDNGFVGRWGNRTLLARFGEIQDVKAQAEHRTWPDDLQEDVTRRRFEMIKKPVLNVMALLALLGDRRCAVSGVDEVSADVGVIATRRNDDQVALLVYHSRDRIMSSGLAAIELQLARLPFERAMLVHYRLDDEHGNPFGVWEAMSGPPNPTPEQIARMRQRQEPALLEEPRAVEIRNGEFNPKFDLPLPGVSLILLSAKPAGPPPPVEEVRVEPYEGLLDEGLTDREERLISWRSPDSRMIRTYEVLYAGSPDGSFQRINEADLICTAFLHMRDKANGEGYYKVRAVDYWGRRSDGTMEQDN